MPSSFTHLHVHTEYSILDGASRIDDLVKTAVDDGQPALGITDHGNMYGVIDFYKACREGGIKPIIGTEAYMAKEARSERPPRRGRIDDGGGEVEGGAKLYYHLTLLAENNAGYKNLIQLASRAFLEGYYYKPRVDWELLEAHSEGLIATTGCLGGHVLQSLLNDNYDEAVTKAARLQDIFGKGNLFVEIQDHGIPEQLRTNPELIRLAAQIGAPLLATNDSHYTHRHDAESHDALLCVQTGSQVTDTDRLKFHGDEHYLKSAAEMRKLFADFEGACDSSLLIAERANVEIEFGQPQLPEFPIPEGFEGADDYLRHKTMEGAKARWGSAVTDEITERLLYELRVISDMGFSSYFLITWDLIRYARQRGIRVGPGRGSAAGCAVAYCLQITDLDPIRYDLLFERFLNPSRVSMPDIDMDFDSRYRDEIVRYAAEKYGRDHVAQIITFSSIKARAALRDSARVLGFPYMLGDKLAKAVPPLIMGRDTPLWACLENDERHADGYLMAAELREMYSSDPDAQKVIDVAKGLEGMRRQDSIHAAAVVITKEPLTEYLPIQRKPSSDQTVGDAPVVTQYEMHAVEELGLLKMDFLGLRNLDVIEDAVELIERSRGTRIDIDNVPLDDQATYEMMARGDTVGVFQLESAPLRALIRSLKPTCFDDVAALVALYRPGPMAANMHNDYADRKNGRKPVEFFHEDAEEILADTYGLMIYQESVMRVAQKFAGYSLADADNLRKACGKKDRELMAKERDSFVDGCQQQGYGSDLGTQLFDIIEQFADYAFNKSHSYGYGLIAYQVAYLKANYPGEYMAALLTSVKTKLERAAVYLAECRQLGIQVTVPDVNVSEMDFVAVNAAAAPATNGTSPTASAANATVSGTNGTHATGNGSLGAQKAYISFGLSAVRGVGEGPVKLVLEERNENGPFGDFYDFCDRVDPQVLNKGTIESLIKAGGFDSMGHPRQGLLNVFEAIMDRALTRQREREQGVMSLFGEASAEEFEPRVEIPDVDFSTSRRLSAEKEMLGLYVSDHPLNGLEALLDRKTTHRIDALTEVEDGTVVTVAGVVGSVKKKWTKRTGELMAVCELEDLYATTEVTVFPKAMSEHGHKLEEESVVVIRARVERRDDLSKLICFQVETVDTEAARGNAPLMVKLGSHGLSQDGIDAFKSVLSEHPGSSDVILMLGVDRKVKLSPAYRVEVDSGLIGELRAMLGQDSIAV